jgi:hypothetical protein
MTRHLNCSILNSYLKLDEEVLVLDVEINAPQLTMPMGVILERRSSENQWIDFEWSVTSVLPGAAEIVDWIRLSSGSDENGDWVQYHAATLPLEIHRKETEGYKYNLSLQQPSVFIILRESDEEDDDHEMYPFLVTVCPYEAQDYLDSGAEIVDNVPMPEPVMGWLANYIEHHHVDEPFKKRKRKAFDPRKEGYDKPPPPISHKYNRPSS